MSVQGGGGGVGGGKTKESSAANDPLVVLSLREEWERQKLLERVYEFSDKSTMRIFVGTWNVGGSKPPPLDVLAKWLTSDTSQLADICVIGLQEIVELTPGAGFADSEGIAASWSAALLACVNAAAGWESSSLGIYVQVTCVVQVGLLLCVFVRSQHMPRITNCSSGTIDNGVIRRNGAVAVSLFVDNSSFCFVNSHLSPHAEKVLTRNKELVDISRRLQFPTPQQRTSRVMRVWGKGSLGLEDHDSIFWLGDLNYRVELTSSVARSLLATQGIASLLKADQLSTHRRTGGVFAGFHEGAILFQPTYKYDRGTSTYDSSDKQRTPSWCDRILWRCTTTTATTTATPAASPAVGGGEAVRQLVYNCADIASSDHRPVFGVFLATVTSVDEERLKVVRTEVLKALDLQENNCLPSVTIDPPVLSFEALRFGRTQMQQVRVRNTGRVYAMFHLRQRSDTASKSAQWLDVSPSRGMLMPGDECVLDVRANVRGAVSAQLVKGGASGSRKRNSGEEGEGGGISKLKDVLGLVVEEGREHYILVNGFYRQSCFGTPLTWLVLRRGPLVEPVSTAKRGAAPLIEFDDEGEGEGEGTSNAAALNKRKSMNLISWEEEPATTTVSSNDKAKNNNSKKKGILSGGNMSKNQQSKWQQALERKHEMQQKQQQQQEQKHPGSATPFALPSCQLPVELWWLLGALRTSISVNLSHGSALLALFERAPESAVYAVVDALDAGDALDSMTQQALSAALLLFLRELPVPLVPWPILSAAAASAASSTSSSTLNPPSTASGTAPPTPAVGGSSGGLSGVDLGEAFDAVCNAIPFHHYVLLVNVISVFRLALDSHKEEADMVASIVAPSIVRPVTPASSSVDSASGAVILPSAVSDEGGLADLSCRFIAHLLIRS